MREFDQKYLWDFEKTSLFDGLNNPMIEHFSGGYYHLAREVIQNSIDAPDDIKKPVRVVFTQEFIPLKFFPGIKRFKEILELCNRSWDKNPEVQEFITKAQNVIGKEQIPLLKISDYNTIGLQGQDDDMSGGWFSLVKSRGASSKRTGEGGSFGIGKGAAFKTSPLRTVFYSTYSKDGFRKFQGIAELVTFKDQEGPRRGTGSFGSRNYGSIKNPSDIPEFFLRKETGLDIYIAGATLDNNQSDELVKSVLRNFWYAIYRNELIVEVADEVISKETLENLLVEHFEDQPTKDHIEPVGNPLTYYEAVAKGKRFETDLPILGKVLFYFYKTSEHLNHVAMIRKSHMIIYSKQYRHPDAFAGVFICDNKDGNTELRKMEPPAHDKWDPERNEQNGYQIIEEIVNWIRGKLKELREIQSSGFQEVPGLSKYLPFNDESQNGDNGNNETQEIESEEETASLMQKENVFESFPVINPYEISVLNTPEKGMGGDGTVIRRKKKKIKTKKKRTGGGSGNTPSVRPTPVQGRSYLLERKGDIHKYAVVLNPSETIKCSLKLRAVGEDAEEPIVIRSAEDEENQALRFNNNTVSLVRLEAGKKKKVFVELDSAFKLSLKIQINDLQQ
ncbi:MAG: hypothetical protein RJQ09_19395 [Cyclobacteriaceae bacterium]